MRSQTRIEPHYRWPHHLDAHQPWSSISLCQVAALASNSTLVWTLIETLWTLPTPSGDVPDSDRYYSGFLYLEALLHLSGRYRVWLPAAAHAASAPRPDGTLEEAATRPPPARGTTAVVQVDGTAFIGMTSATSWACVGLDWWPSSKCDCALPSLHPSTSGLPSHCVLAAGSSAAHPEVDGSRLASADGRCAWGNASMLHIDLASRRLRGALSALSPVFLRLGGSLCDFVAYDVPSDPQPTCDDTFSGPTTDTRIGYPLASGCLRSTRWDELNRLCDATGCSVVFGINALVGRRLSAPCPADTNCRFEGQAHPCCTEWEGAWDSTNAEALLRYTRAQGHRVWGFEVPRGRPNHAACALSCADE
jgi:hypothetical protein